MKLEWKHPKIDKALLVKGNEYLILWKDEVHIGQFAGFVGENELDEWEVDNSKGTYIFQDEIYGFCLIPPKPNYADELGALAIKLGNAESEKLLGKKITNTGEATLTTRQKVELDQKIDFLRKEIERNYDLFKLTNKSND